MATLKGTKGSKVTAGSVREALRARFAAPAWAFFEEVGNATGYGCNRHADGVAMSLWPSRGLELHGIEIKVSRADWLSELKNPKKADDIAKYCSRWWLAVGEAAIVQPGELPATWGLLVLDGGKLVCKTEAPKLEAQALDVAFVAALLRKAHEAQVSVQAVARQEGLEQGRSEGPAEHAEERKRLATELESLKRGIQEFEDKSGIELHHWYAGKIGDALKKFMALSNAWDPEPAAKLNDAADELERHAKELRAHSAKLDKQLALVNAAKKKAANG